MEVQREFYAHKVGTDPNGFAGKSKFGNCVYLGELDSEGDSQKVTYQQYHPLKLTLNKIDEDTNLDIKDVGIQILIKDVIDGKTSWNWLTSNYQKTTDYSKAGTFLSGKELTGVPIGEYYFYEVTPHVGYYLEDQSGYMSAKPSGCTLTFPGKYAYLGSLSVNEDNDKFSFTGENHEGWIRVNKVDEVTGDAISGVGISILVYANNGGWYWVGQNRRKNN